MSVWLPSRRAGLCPALLISFCQVLVIAAGGSWVNALAAFAFARLWFPGRELMSSMVVTLIILPVEVLAVPAGDGGAARRALPLE
jgi:multiple sugar transport system permease protein/fructooligosaccharide transport system permease protein